MSRELGREAQGCGEVNLCVVREGFQEEVTQDAQVPYGTAASTHHRAHLHHNTDHVGWPLPTGHLPTWPEVPQGQGPDLRSAAP